MTKINKKDALKLKKSLPVNYCETIKNKLQESGRTISNRYVLKIVSGEAVDNYGVIDMATDLAIAEKQKKDKISKKLKQL